LYERAEGPKSTPLTRKPRRLLPKEVTVKRHNTRAPLRVEVLEQREVPSSFQWGIGRGVAEASPRDGLVAEVRLRRVVLDQAATSPPVHATALTGGSALAARPIEILSFNF
jgi:hypothetical protein